tara:strand:+ start:72 stop:236 length:165 start_codon:yes stop_codon:yes gene_type:complete
LELSSSYDEFYDVFYVHDALQIHGGDFVYGVLYAHDVLPFFIPPLISFMTFSQI